MKTVDLRDRRRAGFSIGKMLFWGGFGFALYSAYCFVPVYLSHARVEGAISNVLKYGDHTLADSFLRDRALKASASVSYEPALYQIDVWHDRAPGTRTIHVVFDLPITVSYLGADRTITRRVHAQQTWPVNEADETRLAGEREDARNAEESARRESQMHLAEYKYRMREECTRHTTTTSYVTHITLTQDDGNTQVVPCSAVMSWE